MDLLDPYNTAPVFTMAQFDSVCRTKNERIAQLEKALHSALRSAERNQIAAANLSEMVTERDATIKTIEADNEQRLATVEHYLNRAYNQRDAAQLVIAQIRDAIAGADDGR